MVRLRPPKDVSKLARSVAAFLEEGFAGLLFTALTTLATARRASASRLAGWRGSALG